MYGSPTLLDDGTEPPPHNDSSMVPLTVTFVERFAATGLIPTTPNRKDGGMPSDTETLTARIIDRSIRPMMVPTADTVDVTTQVYSYSRAPRVGGVFGFNPTTLAVNTTAAALYSAGLLTQPIAAVGLGVVVDEDGKPSYIVDPRNSVIDECDGYLLYTGCEDGVIMIEFNSTVEQKTVGVKDKWVEECIKMAAERCLPIFAAMEEVRKHHEETHEFVTSDTAVSDPVYDAVFGKFGEDATSLFSRTEALSKTQRGGAEARVLSDVTSFMTEQHEGAGVTAVMERLLKEGMRTAALNGRRSDGRGVREVRALTAAAPVLPSAVHGSSLFGRGETQCVGTVTLGPPGDGCLIRNPYVDMKVPETAVVEDELPVGR